MLEIDLKGFDLIFLIEPLPYGKKMVTKSGQLNYNVFPYTVYCNPNIT